MNNLVTSGGPTLLDASYFTQVMSLADVMASSSLLPKTLTTEKQGNQDVALPFETIKANCFLIANQAFKWKADPFAVAAACSVVHGRLMFEGKLVHAILEANLGIKLRIKFGKWDAKKDRCDLSEEGENGNLAARIYEELPGGAEGRFVDGYVDGWKTTTSNSPWRPGTYRKQLLYRGSREWSRWFEPGIMIGVITDDEIDLEPKDITPAASEADGVLSRLKAKKTIDGEGFDANRVKTETEESAAVTRAADDEAHISESSSDDKGVDADTASASASAKTDEPQKDRESDGASAGSVAGEDASQDSPATQNKTDAADVPSSDNGTAPATAKGGNAEGAAWLQNVTKMLWTATYYGGDIDVLKAQRKAAAASYSTDGIDAKWTKKATSVYDRCCDIVSCALEPDDGLDMIAGLSGLEASELQQIWKKRG